MFKFNYYLDKINRLKNVLIVLTNNGVVVSPNLVAEVFRELDCILIEFTDYFKDVLNVIDHKGGVND